MRFTSNDAIRQHIKHEHVQKAAPPPSKQAAPPMPSGLTFFPAFELVASEVSFRALVTNPGPETYYNGSASSSTAASETSYDSDSGSEHSASTTATSVCSGGMAKEQGINNGAGMQHVYKHKHEQTNS